MNRNGKEFDVKVKPVKVSESEYKIGIWARDDTQGIGTLTFITKDGKYGALGHEISDVDTGNLLDSNDGLLYIANIWGIRKGENGKPGGLCGSIDYEKSNELGDINKNTNIGIYGTLDSKKMDELIGMYDCELIPVANKTEVKTKEAYILSAISGELEKYDIEVVEVNQNPGTSNKGMIIKVTDEKLLELTNGIIQGMSGSPIIQNGKLIGAVTHVFVNDPTKGYGIFAQTMLEQ